MNVKMADRLVELRKKSGYSQEELADKLGISRQAVSKWERAESAPDTDNLIALSKLYNTSIDVMLDINEVSSSVPLKNGNESADTIKVSDSKADDYLRMYKRGGLILGLGIIGVFLSVISILSLIEFAKAQSVGFIVFFVVLAAAVGIILSGVFPLGRFEYIEKTKKLIELTDNKQIELTAKYKKFAPKFFALLIASICMTVLSIIPVAVFQNMIAIIIMLGIIALSAFIIVIICFEYSVYEKLLGIKNK